MRVVLTGGGTAGHIYPLLSVSEALKKELTNERLEILYLGGRGGLEEEILKETGLPAYFISWGKWRRYWLKRPTALLVNLWDFLRFLLGFLQSFVILLKFRPEVVLAKGGYVSLPVVLAAFFCHVPVITHESDAVMGISNRLIARLAEKVCLSFPVQLYSGLPLQKLVYTGNPIREDFFQKRISKANQKTKPTILVMGGSQGAQPINETIFQMIPEILKIAQVVHLTGKTDFAQAKEIQKKLPPKLGKDYRVFDFVKEEMPQLMQEADLIISRAGANALFEIAAVGKPSILVPLKYAAQDHQTKNALFFQKEKAAVVIPEDELSPKTLFKLIKKMLADQVELQKMSQRAKSLAQPKAAFKIATEVIKLKSV